MAVQIEAGKSYRAADGRKWVRARRSLSGRYWILTREGEGNWAPFTDQGILDRGSATAAGNPNNLVEEWAEEATATNTPRPGDLPGSRDRTPAPEPMTKAKLLDAAKAAVADRGLNYGRPEDNFDRIARRWQVHFQNRYGLEVKIDAADVSMLMADMKLARLENDPHHLDSWTDLAGYAACGAEITGG